MPYSFSSCSVIATSRVAVFRLPTIAARDASFVRLGFYLTIAGFLGTFVQYAMISYLTKYHGEATAGIYQSGFLIICSYAGLLFNAISLEYFPRLSQIASRPKMASVAVSHEIAIAMYVLVPVVIVFLAADRLILRLLFSSEFMVALPMITVGITMLIFRGISFCLAIVILARGEGRTYIITESLSSVIGLALNISFFHYWGYLGVAVSFIIWYFIYCIITGVVYYRNFGMRLTPGVSASSFFPRGHGRGPCPAPCGMVAPVAAFAPVDVGVGVAAPRHGAS